MGLEEFKRKYLITDEEIAKVIGVSKQSVRMWRWMKNTPNRNGNDIKLAELIEKLNNANVSKWYKGQAFDYLMECER